VAQRFQRCDETYQINNQQGTAKASPFNQSGSLAGG
jgi:hypothetical protein